MLTPPFSVQLRSGTQAHHRLAETTTFIQAFFKGNFSLKEYGLYLLQLVHVYRALENAMHHYRIHPLLKNVFFEQLNRAEPLARDLDHYFNSQKWETTPLTEPTQLYVDRIRYIQEHQDYLLIAHAYTRYLGDLSGGQAMKKILIRSYPGESQGGVHFYEFPQIADFNAFKDQYRLQLDELTIDQAMANEIVEEARTAFEFNRQLTESLSSYQSL